MARYVSYLRVSTDRQGVSGLGLEAQREAVRQFIGDEGALVEEYVETESGKRSDRPELERAIKAAKRERATLVIAKLDRLARSVRFIADLMERVDFRAADIPQATPFMLHIHAAVAEEEGRRISERTRQALAAAKARGTRLGSPVPERGSALGAEAAREAADDFAARVEPIIAGIERAGVTSLAGIAQALNARGVASRRGGQWQAAQVSRVLARAR